MKDRPIEGELPQEDRECLGTAEELLNQRDFSVAIQMIRERIGRGVDSTRLGLMLRAELAGLLIDIGGEGQISDAVTEGLRLLEADEELLRRLVDLSSYEYNIGNAKLALFDIEARRPGFSQSLQSIETLVAAKNHFWRAYKLGSRSIGDLRFRLLVNLGNALASSGRLVEALGCYRRVLDEAPQFGMAHLQLARGLMGLRRLTRRGSKRLAQQASAEFHQAADSPSVPPAARKQARDMETKLTTWLQSKGTAPQDLPVQAAEAEAEGKPLSGYRRFCVANGLALCEHALYCNCGGSRRDNLMVATREEPLAGTFVPRNELLLNRLKAEFGWARLQFYQSACDHDLRWELHEQDVTYTELFEDEAIGVSREMLRSSFRHCFGILDKIAVGISNLFGVADPGEALYFGLVRRNRGSTPVPAACQVSDRGRVRVHGRYGSRRIFSW